MLTVSRWKTAAILGLTVAVCLAALPGALPAHTFTQLPQWAQRKVVLGYDLTGGERIQLAVDERYVRSEQLEKLRDDMRGLLREGRVGYSGLSIWNGGVQLWIREPADLPRAVTALGSLVRPYTETAPVKDNQDLQVTHPDGRPSVTARRGTTPEPQFVMDVADRMVRLTVTESAIRERVAQSRHDSADVIERRFRETGFAYKLQRVGEDRVVIETPNLLEGWRRLQF